MAITISQFVENPNKYALLSHKENIELLDDNGIVITILVSPTKNRNNTANNLYGCAPIDISPDQIRDERLNNRL